jgi:eukaryotic-like serine/threonine-protein kinase
MGWAMELPLVAGVVMGKTIGSGGCGQVTAAIDGEGSTVAVKVFDERCIAPELIKTSIQRLESGGWPVQIVQLISTSFAAGNHSWVTELLADHDETESWQPRNLEARWHQHPGDNSWALVRKLAQAMAALHQRQVAHGNLKPGNVFFDAAGGLLISDWALGNMPGVAHFEFTDALLYQAPEQLRDQAGYWTDAGYRWDVFAFGALAYRLVTGRFSRCDETFQKVAPHAGQPKLAGIKADLGKMAVQLEQQPEIAWPSEPQNPLEIGLRGWIERCLELSPERRPATMLEVVAGFAALDRGETLAPEPQPVLATPPPIPQLQQQAPANRRLWLIGAFSVAAMAMLAAAIMATMGLRLRQQLKRERQGFETQATALKLQAERAISQKQEFAKIAKTAEQAVTYERELSVARLEASRLIGDQLFGWAMEKGHRRLPPLDGRELRLKRLERYFEDFLTRNSEIPDLATERARVRLQLAEISLAAGDAPLAKQRLAETLTAWASLPQDVELKFRLATDALLLALLRQANGEAETQPAFTAARQALEQLPQSEVDLDRLNQLLAILDFHEARALASKGDDTKALGQLLRATKTLNRIAEQRPDVAILRSELAACYLSSATILEGMGSLGDAREVRALATVELVKLLNQKPNDAELRLDLAGCYGAMAESAILSGDVAAAETLSNQALQLLDQLLLSQPDNAEALTRKATQLGLRAGVQRDRGSAADAVKSFDEGIRMLESVKASAPHRAMVSYRLALLWWQKGKMLGISGNYVGEVALIRQARDLLGKLEVSEAMEGPRPDQLQRSVAYLLGDLGHAQQMLGQKAEASAAFRDGIELWQGLLGGRPQSEEYSEGLAWCRQRINDLK